MIRPDSITLRFGAGPHAIYIATTAAVAVASIACGVVVAVGINLIFVTVLIAATFAVLAVRHFERDGSPVVLLLGVSALAALVFLPALRGDFGRRDEYELYGFAVGGGVVLSGLMTLSRRRLPLRLIAPGSTALDLTMAGFILLALVSGLIGLLNEHRLTYIASDTFRLISMPAAYWISAACITNLGTLKRVLLAAALLLTLQQARDGATALGSIGADAAQRITAVLWMQNLVAAIALVILASNTRRFSAQLLWLGLSGLVLAVGLTSGYRSYLALVALAIAAVIYISPRGATAVFTRLFRPALIVAVLAVLMAMTVPAIRSTVGQAVEHLIARTTALTAGSFDPSAEGRDLEVGLVVGALSKDPSLLPLGAGSGATYELPSRAGEYALQLAAANNYQVHNVHNSFAGMAYRHGLVGVSLLGLLFLIAVVSTARLVRRSSDRSLWLPYIAAVIFAGASPFFFFVPGDVVFAVFVGAAAGMNRAGETAFSDAAIVSSTGASQRRPREGKPVLPPVLR